VILVSRYDLRRPVTAANVGGVKAEVDGVIAGLAGKHVPGRRVDFGGLPGYAPETRAALNGACDEALRTLERRRPDFERVVRGPPGRV
jgi:hypothetical protein